VITVLSIIATVGVLGVIVLATAIITNLRAERRLAGAWDELADWEWRLDERAQRYDVEMADLLDRLDANAMPLVSPRDRFNDVPHTTPSRPVAPAVVDVASEAAAIFDRLGPMPTWDDMALEEIYGARPEPSDPDPMPVPPPPPSKTVPAALTPLAIKRVHEAVHAGKAA
jgi:hypothetical protein